ncbi:RagB/SusD family nutrient uptake outer membrane protein [Ancylomarina sp. 16SWW S1-10-2]|uniref:RagB/SusD family nutrient uptake outer membrane protein n=1 Tax=Ancylomarina sp. 16SWW S1-10-2 TaxID=2499681 RepID=UPI0012AD6CA7|nr:RagB/SusD family nutrient uptake outer membrane protein [Ancylomarina sp. 16SWW S1-10-2]MRT93719.1 RagB/SusD family nutrient uptake outer membrane protein [Ancylomarina sp. 16SWW S1-10-2]
MKTYIIYIITFFLSILCVSCDDWLDVSPKAEIESTELFETEQGFQDALTGVYISLSDNSSYGKYLSWHILEDLAHQYDVSSGNYEGIQNYDFENTTSLSVIKSIWLHQYNTIAEINLLLESIDKYGRILDTDSFNEVKGQALALRAYCHFDLLRLYGHGNLENRADLGERLTIPYVTEYTNDITEQKSYNQTFILLEKDIDEALQLLDSEADKVVTHMNYDAALAFKARVCLWQGKKVEALQLVEQLLPIDAGWATSESGAYFEDEDLFRLNVTLLSDYIDDFYSSDVNQIYNSNRLIQTEDYVFDIFNIQEGSGEGQTDLRYLHQHKMESSSEWLTIKLKPAEDATTDTYYIPMLKIAEVYLIAIECYASEIEGGDLTKAIEYLNKLKEERNIMPAFFLEETSSAEDVEAAICQEYRKEFIQEGQLFYFYKRKGMTSFARQTGEAANEMTDENYVLPYPDIEIEFGRVQEI